MKRTCKSTQAIADELQTRGVVVSADTVGRCLREMGYSLHANVKGIGAAQYPDRDGQFRHINKRVNEGLVHVGISHDTAEFAVASIRRWWKAMGRRAYPEANRQYADQGWSPR